MLAKEINRKRHVERVPELWSVGTRKLLPIPAPSRFVILIIENAGRVRGTGDSSHVLLNLNRARQWFMVRCNGRVYLNDLNNPLGDL